MSITNMGFINNSNKTRQKITTKKTKKKNNPLKNFVKVGNSSRHQGNQFTPQMIMAAGAFDYPILPA